jgi:Lrp/AsnC family transcriptional regulator for asnA, asnC and gidA
MADSGEVLLDEMDLAILSHLEEDGRKTYSDIASSLGVTVSTISTRVKRLIDRRVLTILGFLDPGRVGFNVPATVFISARPGHAEAVAEAVSELPEVSWVALFTGDFDVLAEIYCRDVDHLANLLTKHIQPIVGVEKTRASIHLRRVKFKQPSVSLLKSQDPTKDQ